MAKLNDLKVLDDSQVEAFDTEYVYEALWKVLQQSIDRDFPDGRFRFIDIGGGNGVFADKMLSLYPNSTGVLLDNSQMLINKNTKHPRKILICDSLENLRQYEECMDVDIVCINWVLHHLVSTSRRQTLANIRQSLADIASLLNNRGRMSIYENMYNGLIFDTLPSKLIFALTSSKALAPLTRKLGANTAGCGVCFLSKMEWDRTFDQTGLQVLDYDESSPWPTSALRKIALHLGPIRIGHYWLKVKD